MLDAIILFVFSAACFYLVRRVRHDGFASIVPSAYALAMLAGLRRGGPAGFSVASAGQFAGRGRFPLGRALGYSRAVIDGPAEAEQSVPIIASKRLALAWGGGIVGLGAAISLQQQLWANQGPLTPFWLLIAAGAAFTLVAAWGMRQAIPAHPTPADLADSEPAESAFDLRRARLAVLGVVFELIALFLFALNANGTVGWTLHALSMPLFLVGVWQAARVSWRGLAGSWSRVDWVAVGVLTLAGLAVRVWQLSDVPRGIWFDESYHALALSVRIMQDPGFRPVWLSGTAPEAAAYWYLAIPFLSIWPHDAMAIRLPAAISGALGVGAVYLLARALWNRTTALIAAGLAVGLTWHVNYSRVAFNSMPSVFLDTLAAALFVVAIRRRSGWAFAAAGLALGAGMHFYYTSRIALAILAIVALYRLIAMRMEFVRAYWRGLALFFVGFVLAAGPMLQYAIRYPDEFNQRTAQVTVMKEVEAANSWQPLVDNLKAHLLMFNVRGDPNGRHNWTGRPMLDPVTGALAVLGLGIAIYSWRRWEYALALGWAALMLAGGVLSVTWEAPQSLRTIDEVTAVVLLASLPLGTLAWGFPLVARAWRQTGGTREPIMVPVRELRRLGALSITAVGVVVVFATVANIERYFVYQQNDPRTWSEFQTAQAEAARRINDIPMDWTIYLDQAFLGAPSLNFRLRQPRQFKLFDAASLPIESGATAIFLSDGELSSAARVEEMYPNAERDLVTVGNTPNVGMYGYRLTAQDVRSSHGVLVQQGPPDARVAQEQAQLVFAPEPSSGVRSPFPLEAQATLLVTETDLYRFRLEGGGTAYVDGQPIPAGQEISARLARGVHAVRIEAEEPMSSPIQLSWARVGADFEPIPGSALFAPPIRASGLEARLFSGSEPVGEPALLRIDPTVEQQVHQLPLPRPYTVEWVGAVAASEDGDYRFGTTSIDASWVWIDGRPIVQNTTPNQYQEGTVRLSAGWHDIRVRFLDMTSFTHVRLFWQPPGKGREIVPSTVLRPYAAERVLAAQPTDQNLQALAVRPTRASAGAASTAPAAPAGPIAPPGLLAQPRGVALGSDGTVYISDFGLKSIVALPPGGGEPQILARDQLKEPSDLAVMLDGALIVLDAAVGSAFRVGPDGALGSRLIPEIGMYGPRGVSVGTDGRIAIADTGNNRVILLDARGGQPQMVGGLKEPTGAAFLADGTLLVADTGSKQFVQVRRDGQRGDSWPMPNAFTVVGPHVTALPRGGWVATAPEERTVLYMAPNARSPEVWASDPAWKKPVGVAADRTGVYIADPESGLVTRLELPR